MVIAKIGKASENGAMSCSDERMKIRELVLAKSDVGANKCGLELGKGARGRYELRECFPKICKVRINEKCGVELHLLLIMGDSCSLEEALELCEVAVDLRWVRRVKEGCIRLAWDWHVKSWLGHVSRVSGMIGKVVWSEKAKRRNKRWQK
jgi:hypothetical protein